MYSQPNFQIQNSSNRFSSRDFLSHLTSVWFFLGQTAIKFFVCFYMFSFAVFGCSLKSLKRMAGQMGGDRSLSAACRGACNGQCHRAGLPQPGGHPPRPPCAELVFGARERRVTFRSSNLQLVVGHTIFFVSQSPPFSHFLIFSFFIVWL